jgi:hypothetical protein
MYKQLRSGFCLGVFGAMAALSTPGWAADGQLMDLTMHIQEHMEGMPALPAHTVTRQICSQAGPFDPHALAQLQSDAKCKITQYEKQGDVVSFVEICAAPQSVTSQGVFHLTGGPDFTGTMHTSMDAAGHAVTVDTAYTGKQVGSCDPAQQPTSR